MITSKPLAVAEEISNLFKDHGQDDYIGEKVSQIQHMTQCAALATAAGHDEEVILAALLHDIGHLCEYVMSVERMDEFGVVDHEELGYQYLKSKGFSSRICKLVASHVEAKRYLTFKYPQYFELLSEASKATLEYQGGPMLPEEANRFERDPLFQYYLLLRRWDDQAKDPTIAPPPFETFTAMITRHLEGRI
jgi:phosphonate degradation associated HDIG domain protein